MGVDEALRFVRIDQRLFSAVTTHVSTQSHASLLLSALRAQNIQNAHDLLKQISGERSHFGDTLARVFENCNTSEEALSISSGLALALKVHPSSFFI